MSKAISTKATTLSGQVVEVCNALQQAELAVAQENRPENINITSDSEEGTITIAATIPATLTGTGGIFSLTPVDYV